MKFLNFLLSLFIISSTFAMDNGQLPDEKSHSKRQRSASHYVMTMTSSPAGERAPRIPSISGPLGEPIEVKGETRAPDWFTFHCEKDTYVK